MSRDDRPVESDEGWKRREQDRIHKQVAQALRDTEERNKRGEGDIGDLKDSLDRDSAEHDQDGSGQHQDQGDTGAQQAVVVKDHHQVEVHAAHPYAGIDVIASISVAAVIEKLANVAGTVADLADKYIKMVGEKNFEADRARIAEGFSEIAGRVGQAIEDIEQWVKEQASPEKTQEMEPPDAPAQEVAPPEKEPEVPEKEPEAPAQKLSPPEKEPEAPAQAQAKTAPDPHDPAVAAIHERQAAERAELEQKLATGRDRLEARLEDKPEDVRKGLRDSFNEAAKDARDQKAAQHAEELRKLKEDRPPPDRDL
jgi:hypothetical protein